MTSALLRTELPRFITKYGDNFGYSIFMERRKKLPNGYWNNLDNCLAEARKYQTISEWQKGSPLSYRWAAKNGWLEKCSAHMAISRVPDGYWTLERCKEVASKYKTKVEWRAGDRASFSAANRQKWISECCGHMETGGLWFATRKWDIIDYHFWCP